MSGWYDSCRAWMKTPEAECVWVVTCVECSVWKWAFTKVLAWAPYCSSWFWKPFPRSFVQNVPRKPVCRLPGHHHWIATGITTAADPVEDQQGRKGTSSQHGQSQGLGRGSMSFRSMAKTPVACVSKALAPILFSVVVVPVGSTRNAVASLAVWSLMPASDINSALGRPDQ